MTRDAGFKRLVRSRMAKTGESYAAARAQLVARDPLRSLPPADLELVSATAAPISAAMRVQDAAAWIEVLRKLSEGQRMLFAFWVVVAHGSDGLYGFVDEMPHRVVHDGMLTLLESGMRLVEGAELLAVFDQLRSAARAALEAHGLPPGLGSAGDLSPAEFDPLLESLGSLEPETVQRLDTEYRRVLPGVAHRVARYIRLHPDQFHAAV